MKTTPRKSASPPSQANNFTPMNASQLNGVAGGGAGGNGGGNGGGTASRTRRDELPLVQQLGRPSGVQQRRWRNRSLLRCRRSLAALQLPLERGDSLGQRVDRPTQLSQAIEGQQDQNKTKTKKKKKNRERREHQNT